MNELRYVFKGDYSRPEDMNTFIRSNVGNLCYVSRMPENLEGHISIGVWDDEIVVDSVTNKARLHFVKQPDLFRGYFEKTDLGLTMVFPSRLEITGEINAARSKVTERSEESLLESVGAKILRIPTVQNQIHPIMVILDSVINTSSVSLKDLKKSNNTMRYVEFLSNLDIVKMEGKNIVPGRFMSDRMDGDMDVDELYVAMMNRIVERGMTRIFTDLHVKHLQPFIHMTNANCMTSRIEDKPLMWDWTIYERYLKKIYSESPKMGIIVSNAQDLKRADIMTSERKEGGNTMYSCKDEIFIDYSKKFRPREIFA